MARISTIFLVFIILTPVRLGAQGRGHHNGGAAVFNGGAAVRNGGAPVRTAPAPMFIGRSGPLVSAPPLVYGQRFPMVRHQPTIIATQPYGIYSPYFWPSPLSVAPVYAEPVISAAPIAPQTPVASQSEVDLAYQVGRLSQEIEQLRQQQALASRPAAPEPPAVPTTLVFRDGHRIDIQNYAIVGQTLWVLDERTSTRINLADLDLEAIQKENRGRGVRFPLPQR